MTIDRQDQAEAWEWCRRYQVHDRVAFHQGEIEQIAPRLEVRFDFVFVNTEPEESSVGRGIEAALPLLDEGGLLAFPNYPDPGWPGVRRVVDEYAGRLGWRRFAQADFLGVFRSAGS